MMIQYDHNDSTVAPGDPYPFEGKTNPYTGLLKTRFGNHWPASNVSATPQEHSSLSLGNETENRGFSVFNAEQESIYQDRLWRGTTSIEACDEEGWVVSVTPSGGWLPACIAGNTGIGMSQRMQSFVLDSTLNPYNVLAPHKKPRVTLTPSLAMKDGRPFLSFAVQGGDTQDQNLLQLFLNIVEFNMTVQQASEAANFNTDQLWLSLGGDKKADRAPRPGYILLNNKTTEEVRQDLQRKGYTLRFADQNQRTPECYFLRFETRKFLGRQQQLWRRLRNRLVGLGWTDTRGKFYKQEQH